MKRVYFSVCVGFYNFLLHTYVGHVQLTGTYVKITKNIVTFSWNVDALFIE